MLNSTISIILKLRNVPDVLPSLLNLMEDESIIVDELIFFASNIKKGVCVVLKSFLSFLKKNFKNKAHKMFSLMLDPRFKILCLVSSFIGKE